MFPRSMADGNWGELTRLSTQPSTSFQAWQFFRALCRLRGSGICGGRNNQKSSFVYLPLPLQSSYTFDRDRLTGLRGLSTTAK